PTAYPQKSNRQCRAALRARVDRIFTRKTVFVILDRLLARLRANKAELLKVLDHPEIPLHTNGSENDIRCQVTKRKVSGGTRSDVGRDCRDGFLGLFKKCKELGLSFLYFLVFHTSPALPPHIAPSSDTPLIPSRLVSPPTLTLPPPPPNLVAHPFPVGPPASPPGSPVFFCRRSQKTNRHELCPSYNSDNQESGQGQHQSPKRSA